MRILLLCALMLLVVACIPQPLPQKSMPDHVVTGDVTYRERIALPPNATLWVQLVQIDDRGRTLRILDEYEKISGGQVPLAFNLVYDGALLEESGQHALLARIMYQDMSLFATREPVKLPLPTSMEQHLVLQGVAHENPEQARKHLPPTDKNLTGKRWELRTLYGVPLERFDGSPLPVMSFHPNDRRVSGSDGCNNFNASYAQDAAKLDIGMPASTMKLCFDGIDQARAMITALHETDNWRLNGNFLELRRADRLLATFEGVSM